MDTMLGAGGPDLDDRLDTAAHTIMAMLGRDDPGGWDTARQVARQVLEDLTRPDPDLVVWGPGRGNLAGMLGPLPDRHQLSLTTRYGRVAARLVHDRDRLAVEHHTLRGGMVADPLPGIEPHLVGVSWLSPVPSWALPCLPPVVEAGGRLHVLRDGRYLSGAGRGPVTPAQLQARHGKVSVFAREGAGRG